jgi:hypothetical protein
MIPHSWFRKLFARSIARPLRKATVRSRPALELLEDRTVLSTLTVTNTLDNGITGSLRWAITQANTDAAQGQSDTINFDIPTTDPGYNSTTGVSTITLTQDQLELTAGSGTTIDGANRVAIDASDLSRVLEVDAGVTVGLAGLTLVNGSARDGGGIRNLGTLSVSNSTISGNSGAFGGGIQNLGTLSVSNSTISGNFSSYYGGGIANYGQLTVSNSTLSGNSSPYVGGGIANYGQLTVTNSTLSGNHSSYYGGGIANLGQLTVTNSTLSGNSSTHGGGILNANTSTLTVNNSIVANSPAGGDISGSYTGSHNLTGTVALGPLADNGGPTQTMALLPGGPAIDAGDNTLAVDAIGQLLTTDQRGFARISGAAVDIGAFEVQPLSLSTTLSNGTYGATYSQSIKAMEPGGTGGPFTFALTKGSLPPGLNLASDGTLSGTPTAAGSFSFTVTATDSSGFTGSQAYTLTIAKANQTITWSTPADIVYGTPLSATQLDASVSVAGPAAAGAVTYTPAAGTVLAAGHAQTLTVSVAATANYNAATATVYLNVTPAPLTITPAAGQSMILGATVPVLRYSASGFVNGDGPSLLSGLLGTTATASSAIGNYPFTLGTLSAGNNYTLSLSANPPTFAVTPPSVVSTRIDDGNMQRSMVRSLTLTFGSNIASTLSSVMAGLSLTRTDGLVVGLVGSLDSTGKVLTLTFTGSSIMGGSLADGRYNLCYYGTTVLSSAQLWRLFGDLQGTASVNAADKTAFLAALNSRRGMSNYSAYCDYDENGMIVNNDLAAFNLRDGTSI